jgi:hypothetical protein
MVLPEAGSARLPRNTRKCHDPGSLPVTDVYHMPWILLILAGLLGPGLLILMTLPGARLAL